MAREEVPTRPGPQLSAVAGGGNLSHTKAPAPQTVAGFEGLFLGKNPASLPSQDQFQSKRRAQGQENGPDQAEAFAAPQAGAEIGAQHGARR